MRPAHSPVVVVAAACVRGAGGVNAELVLIVAIALSPMRASVGRETAFDENQTV